VNTYYKNKGRNQVNKNEMLINIIRFCSNDKQTLSKCEVCHRGEVLLTFYTVELAWKGNKRSISCIPPKTYQAKKRSSPKFGNHFHILGVPNRSYILIHVGNFYSDVRGCLCPGDSIADINSDGLRDVLNSSDTMGKLNRILPDEFRVSISYGAFT